MTEARKSSTLVNLQVDLANFRSVDPELDFGNDLSIAALVTLMEETQQEIDTLNTTLNTVNAIRRSVLEKEKALKKLKERLQLGIAVKYGKDSKEYRIVNPPTAKRRKTNSTESSNNETENTADSSILFPAPSLN